MTTLLSVLDCASAEKYIAPVLGDDATLSPVTPFHPGLGDARVHGHSVSLDSSGDILLRGHVKPSHGSGWRLFLAKHSPSGSLIYSKVF